MPTYTYKCKVCGYEYDKLQSITAEPDKLCPKCAGEVERLIGGGIGIVFKGSGFYITDYKKNSNDGKSKDHQQSTIKEAKTSV